MEIVPSLGFRLSAGRLRLLADPACLGAVQGAITLCHGFRGSVHPALFSCGAISKLVLSTHRGLR